MSLAGRTLFVTGATRGIGHAIAMRAAADGAHIVIAGKTADHHSLGRRRRRARRRPGARHRDRHP
jgi:NAD(P)-dependent dehydrogenase (short-subunit alcohol dehydrogenase family)